MGTWGNTALNPDLSAIDGYLGGVQTISASSSPITLTSPAGFTPTPSGGPTQAQNAILRVTGVMTAGVQITLPLPGPIIIENLTTGNFVLSFRAIGSGQIIAVDQGEIQTIYNDGTNVRFVNLGGRIGETSIWAGLSAMPSWIGACTVPPYVLCDGSIYNFTAYPYLGKRLGGAFGGNGITTFGVPDLRGRMPLPYDGTGTRITAAISGINGQTLGASADAQGVTLTTPQIPSHNHGITDTGHHHQQQTSGAGGLPNYIIPNNGSGVIAGSNVNTLDSPTGITINNTGGGQSHSNVQPSQVTGIAVIRAA